VGWVKYQEALNVRVSAVGYPVRSYPMHLFRGGYCQSCQSNSDGTLL